MYVRKTIDSYDIQGNYGHGWETVTSEDSRKEATQRLREYKENETGTSFRLIKRRERKN
jgi:hypothetical protein